MTAAAAPLRLDRAALDRAPFPRQLCDDLFAAVLVDDEVDPELQLPDTIALPADPQVLATCYRLCRQLWRDDYDRAALLGWTATLLRERDLRAGDRVRFKHLRARFKHLRYAHALYGAAHRYPVMLDRVTITLGLLQDAYRGGRRGTVAAFALLLRLLLTPPGDAWLRRESDRLTLTSPQAFRALILDDYRVLDALAARPSVTGPLFHAARKRVGRQVSFWDTWRTLEPTADRFRMSRWLSAINGRMGSLHDDLVDARAVDRRTYHAPFVLPDEIRELITALSARVRETIASQPFAGGSSR